MDSLVSEAPVKFNDVKNTLSKMQEKLAYAKIHYDESEERESARLNKVGESCSEQLQNLHKDNFESLQMLSDMAEKCYVDKKLEMDKQFRLRSEN